MPPTLNKNGCHFVNHSKSERHSKSKQTSTIKILFSIRSHTVLHWKPLKSSLLKDWSHVSVKGWISCDKKSNLDEVRLLQELRVQRRIRHLRSHQLSLPPPLHSLRSHQTFQTSLNWPGNKTSSIIRISIKAQISTQIL